MSGSFSWLLLIPGDRWSVWKMTPINQNWELTAGIRAAVWRISCRGEKLFTLLHESDAPISAALEHSDRLQQCSSLLHPTCVFTLWIHAHNTELLPALFHLWMACGRKCSLHYFSFDLYEQYKKVTPIEIMDFIKGSKGTGKTFAAKNMFADIKC